MSLQLPRRNAPTILIATALLVGSTPFYRAAARVPSCAVAALPDISSSQYPGVAGVWHNIDPTLHAALILNRDGNGVEPNAGAVKWRQIGHTIAFTFANSGDPTGFTADLSDDGSTLVFFGPAGSASFVRGAPKD